MKKLRCLISVLAFACLLSACGGSVSEAVTSSPETMWNGEFSITLPEGFTISQDEQGNQLYSNGQQVIGGRRQYTVPDGFVITDYFNKDFLIAMGIQEATDESLGYYAEGNFAGMGPDGWRVEYFSDVPDPKDRIIHVVHQFFVMNDEVTVLDVWIDRMHVDNLVKDQILSSIGIPEIERYPTTLSLPETVPPENALYELLELPEGFSCDVYENFVLFFDSKHMAAGLDVLSIPEGVYDPDDPEWLWLDSLPGNEHKNTGLQYMGGKPTEDNGWIAEYIRDDVPEDHPGYIRRRHVYRVVGNKLYDIWLEMQWLTEEEAKAIINCLVIPEE